jgi:single-strand DNA-binding protein
VYQQITLIGNLGADPEMRLVPSGDSVTSFSVATSRTWVKDGVKQEKTIWFRITAWRKLAELAAQYLTKGRQVFIIGEMEEARPWTDRDGNSRASLEVTAQTIKFLGSKGETVEVGPATPSRVAAAVEEDIPF